MKIEFAGITLGDDGAEVPIRALTVNGVVAWEAVDIVQAAQKKIFGRGNQLVTLQFSVRREFDTAKEAQVFALTHFSTILKGGLCTITCGEGEDTQQVFLAGALLTAAPQSGFRGVESIVSYQVVGPAATTDLAPDFLLGGESMILRGTEDIDAAAETLDVLFSTPFVAAPVVGASVQKPDAGDNIWATVRAVTVNGFSVDLSGPTPAVGYKLMWSAIG